MSISFNFLFYMLRSWITKQVPSLSSLVLCSFLIDSWFFARIRRSAAPRNLDPPFWTFRTRCYIAAWSLRNSWFPWLVQSQDHVSSTHILPQVSPVNAWGDHSKRTNPDSDAVGYWSWTPTQRQSHPCGWTHPWVWSTCFKTQSSSCAHCPGRARTSPSLT